MTKSVTRMFGLARDEGTDDEMVFHPSKTCPECGTKLAARMDELQESQSVSCPIKEDGDSCNSSLRNEDSTWHCPNLDCPALVRQQIEHWCSSGAMDIAIADKPLVAQLVKQGLVFNVAELYSLKLKEVAAMEGRNQQFATDFQDQLAVSKTRAAWRVLYGLSIPLVDAEVAKELCMHFAALDDILPAGPERMSKQAGVAEAVARSIAQWYGDGVNRRLVRRLQKVGVNFKTGLS